MSQIPLAGRLLVLCAALAGCTASPPPMSDPSAAPSTAEPSAAAAAEAAVREVLAGPGVHVVHFWAPWCDNSLAEFDAGLAEAPEAHPDVSFTFVTLWNDGEVGESTLARYGLDARVRRLVVPGERPPAGQRRLTFLDLPVTWIPTTWVFRGDTLATAFNYGEITPAQLAEAIRGAQSSWPH